MCFIGAIKWTFHLYHCITGIYHLDLLLVVNLSDFSAWNSIGTWSVFWSMSCFMHMIRFNDKAFVATENKYALNESHLWTEHVLLVKWEHWEAAYVICNGGSQFCIIMCRAVVSNRPIGKTFIVDCLSISNVNQGTQPSLLNTMGTPSWFSSSAVDQSIFFVKKKKEIWKRKA